ncbi:hypothetical protein FQN50_005304 [Emmonsiellopsis sp. PD_5]|nr:hypothetical protein FQN50_005304 [Emmonsiellopsis sp. PD_5]
MSVLKNLSLLLPMLSALSAFAAPGPVARQVAGLHAGMTAKGKYFGTFSDGKYLDDSALTAVLGDSNEFGSITPGNSMKWDTTESSRDGFNFDTPDQIVNYAAEHNQFIRGHTLVWHSQLPQWVKDISDKDELVDVMNNHITTQMEHYKGKNVDHWDVVNEPFEEDGSFRDSVFYNLLGEEFLTTAFQTAREVDPDVKLYLNEYNNEYGAKGDAFYSLAQKLKDASLIDGVGIQGHYICGELPTSLQSNMERLAALDLDVAITELDIRIESPTTDEALEQQAQDFLYVTEACLAVERCVGITVSATTDKYSWVPGTFPGFDDANLYDRDMQPKPAHASVLGALG